MSLRLEFSIGAREQVEQYELAHGKNPLARPTVANEIGVFALCALGLVAAFKAQSIMLMIPFFLVACATVVAAWKVLRNHRKAVASLLESTGTNQKIALTIDETGLREVVEGVESFAPWSSVKYYARFKSILVLRLAPGTESVIPTVALEPAAESNLLLLLKRNSIPERGMAS